MAAWSLPVVRAGDLGVTLHLGTAAFLQSNSLPLTHWELGICKTLAKGGFLKVFLPLSSEASELLVFLKVLF